MAKLAVIGHPVAHSRSPAMQNAALAAAGLAPEWSYEAIDVAPEGFAELVARMPDEGFAGANVTLPHKLAALELSDAPSPAARAIGAANTLVFRARRIEADNTDAIGLLRSLPRPPAGARALVLGAGGSARAAVWALREAGAQVTIWNRTAAKAQALADEFAVAAAPAPDPSAFDLLVNATKVGLVAANPGLKEGEDPSAAGSPGLKALPVEVDAISAKQVVVDLVYGASETHLIAASRAAGAVCVDGLEILVAQGAASFELWTGVEAPIDVMRGAAREAV